MHNLALAMKAQGHIVTGSDDEIYEPSRSRLDTAGILPEPGWHPERISEDLDVVILGMHARKDNPELLKARELKLKVMSFPEFVASRSENKTRVVVAGSHGKTTTTSMVMHVLRTCGMQFDYLVGAQLPGFDLMVSLSEAPVIIIEGDEYLSSPIDRRPKFVHYRPHITAITGVAWDHMNVFPTLEGYNDQFRSYVASLDSEAKAYLYANDPVLKEIGSNKHAAAIDYYDAVPHMNQDNGASVVMPDGREFPVRFYGLHNFENMGGALRICRDLGIKDDDFFKAMQSFQGAAFRMQVEYQDSETTVIRDFAHAPSKVRATTNAVRERYPEAHISAVVELHTYSSLNRDFMPHYRHALQSADQRIVYYDPHTLEIKRLPYVAPEFIAECFDDDVVVVTNPADLVEIMTETKTGVHLWMSSGRFGGIDIKTLYK